jgi:hypothetical protein
MFKTKTESKYISRKEAAAHLDIRVAASESRFYINVKDNPVHLTQKKFSKIDEIYLENFPLSIAKSIFFLWAIYIPITFFG